jgi:hypothetical protein
MAKIEDYIEQEIDDAATQQRARDEKGRFVPERFRGKDITDVIQSYEELEKLNSRQSQDLGMMRQQVDQLLEAQAVASSPAQEPSKPVSVDDLYEDADGNIRRVVREEALSEVDALRKELNDMRLEKVLDQIDEKFPNWREKVQDPEFLDWAKESPYRVRMVQDADRGDLDAAKEVLGMYYESLTDGAKASKDAQHQQQLRDATLESSSPAQAEMVDTYSRNDLMDKRIAAKAGDLSAERWLQVHGEAIAIAYEEGRIVD